MKKELPVWAILIVGLASGLALLALGVSVDDPKLRRLGFVGGGIVLSLAAYGITTWAWGIHKRRASFDDMKKSPEQINREADALLREAAELVQRNERNDS